MPKLIDYPRTSYPGAWELSEIIDETGGKCSIENAAKKMDRKVSGSFKAIIGSAVKFGLITSKRELLSTTTLFKRIKHAYDKEEELIFHREAFLAPPLFTQLCRKFRNRELPVQMLDVMLLREFNVEEINAQAVAKLFVEGCQMCGILSEGNMMADIDSLNNKTPKRALASPAPSINNFQPLVPKVIPEQIAERAGDFKQPAQHTLGQNPLSLFGTNTFNQREVFPTATQGSKQDAVASLFNLSEVDTANEQPVTIAEPSSGVAKDLTIVNAQVNAQATTAAPIDLQMSSTQSASGDLVYQLSVAGPGINTTLELNEAADVEIALALLEKIRRRFKTE